MKTMFTSASFNHHDTFLRGYQVDKLFDGLTWEVGLITTENKDEVRKKIATLSFDEYRAFMYRLTAGQHESVREMFNELMQ